MRYNISHEVIEFMQSFIDNKTHRKKQYSQHFIKDGFPNASFLMFGSSDGTSITCAKITGRSTLPLYLWNDNSTSLRNFRFNDNKPIDFNYAKWEKNGLDITEAEVIDHDKGNWLLQIDRSKVLVDKYPGHRRIIKYTDYIESTWDHSLDTDQNHGFTLIGGSEATTVKEARIETVPEEARNEDSMLISGIWTAKTDDTPAVITPETIETAKMKPWKYAWELPEKVTAYDDELTKKVETASINALEAEYGREAALRIQDYKGTWNKWNEAVKVLQGSHGVHLLQKLPVYAGKGLECFKDTYGEICVKGELNSTQDSHNTIGVTLPVWTKLLKPKGVSL